MSDTMLTGVLRMPLPDDPAELDVVTWQNLRDRAKQAADRIDALERALRDIAKPKVGPDHDWSDNEINKWRATWYAKYEGIARAALTQGMR